MQILSSFWNNKTSQYFGDELIARDLAIRQWRFSDILWLIQLLPCWTDLPQSQWLAHFRSHDPNYRSLCWRICERSSYVIHAISTITTQRRIVRLGANEERLIQYPFYTGPLIQCSHHFRGNLQCLFFPIFRGILVLERYSNRSAARPKNEWLFYHWMWWM